MQDNEGVNDNPEVGRIITGLAMLKSAVLPTQTEFHFVRYTTITTEYMRIVVAITLKQTLVVVSFTTIVDCNDGCACMIFQSHTPIHIQNANCRQNSENHMSKQSTPPAIHFYTISAKFALATDHVVEQTSYKLTKFPIIPSSHCHHLGRKLRKCKTISISSLIL